MTTKAIACHVRVRPPTAQDGRLDPEAIIIAGNKLSAMNVQGDKRYHYEFEQCHGSSSTQQEVFDGVLPLLEQVYKGINTTIFTYGVTGAGKTHTMQGTLQDPGLIPRTIDHLFRTQARLRKSTLNVAISYVEILKDEVYDLLGDRAEPRKCDIRMNADGQNVVNDVIVRPIDSLTDFSALYEAAAKTRKTASTNLNSSSSRSHAILTLYVEIREKVDPSKVVSGKICLTDLAGSENNNLTGNDRERMRESSAINTSLTTLGKVIDALNLNGKRRQSDSILAFVPYRESKLTRLLQDALGGTSQSLLICCLAPGEKFARDTINTLQFGKKSKSVENRLNVVKHSSRRSSVHTNPLHASHINPLAGFKVHCNVANPGVGSQRTSSGRQPLGSLAPNMRPVKVEAKRQIRDKTTDGKGEDDNKKVVKKAGLEITELELQQKIQDIVSQRSAQATYREETAGTEDLEDNKTAIDSGTPASANVGEDEATMVSEQESSSALPAMATTDRSACEMTAVEKENRARVLVSHARKLHQGGELAQALDMYRKAYEYVPTNNKIALRVTEIELSIEGILPSAAGLVTKETGNTASAAKRSRALPMNLLRIWGMMWRMRGLPNVV